jgi:Plasma-membrane choline transporter
VYVGLYGFGYVEAGRNVIQLFEQKGWTVIITDDLADNVLSMMSVGVGLITGLIGMIAAANDPNLLAGLELANGGTGTAGFMYVVLID